MNLLKSIKELQGAVAELLNKTDFLGSRSTTHDVQIEVLQEKMDTLIEHGSILEERTDKFCDRFLEIEKRQKMACEAIEKIGQGLQALEISRHEDKEIADAIGRLTEQIIRIGEYL